MEIGNFIILIYFCVIGYANSVTYYQAVWYDSYIDNSGDPNINNYHVIKQ